MQTRTNFAHYTETPVYHLRYLGITFQRHSSRLLKLSAWLVVGNFLFIWLHLVAFVMTFKELDLNDLSGAVMFLSYLNVALVRLLAMISSRKKLMTVHEQLRRIYPNVNTEHVYKVEQSMKPYALVERMGTTFVKYLIALYQLLPLVLSIVDLWQTHEYGYRTPMQLDYPISLRQSLLIYIGYYVFETLCCYFVSFTVLASNLFLFSCISQICVHFDMLSKKILTLQPGQEGDLQQLKNIAKQHAYILELAQQINHIFISSLIFTLLTSSFIICFTSYQVVGDIQLIFVIRSMAVVCFELQQMASICYFGNRLIDSSSQVFDAIYMHDWLSGSVEYKRLVRFMMLRSFRPVALRIGGFNHISLLTLTQVLKISYQMFTMLKSSK